jgi:hypothetical protein
MPARVEGVDQVLAALDAAGADVTDRQVNKAAAGLVLAAATPLAPVGPGDDAGKLKGSGKVTATNKVGVVHYGGPQIPWAGPVIFGDPPPRVQGGFVRPNPFPYKAGDQRREDVIDVYTRSATKALTDRLT